MSAPMPANFPDLERAQAELTDLRFVALHSLHDHARGAYPGKCHCSSCRAARRWVPSAEPEHPSVALQSGRR